MPKLTSMHWDAKVGNPHPITGENNGDYAEIVLGDTLGLTQFGARLERLNPQSSSSHRHWHQEEDELVYVVSGELVLVEDNEVILKAGDVAGWPAGSPIAHCLENRSDTAATILVVGTRASSDVVSYPDHDLILKREDQNVSYSRLNGAPIE